MRYRSVSGFAYGRRTANPPPDPAAERSGRADAPARTAASSARPGSARSGVQESPKASTNGAKRTGASEYPSDPPVM